MQDPDGSIDWCVRCGTRHSSQNPCPAVAQATGAEKVVWQGAFRRKDGDLTVHVLVAPVGKGWRARILTPPRSLWVVPRTNVTMKFLGVTAEEARDSAVQFLHGTLPQAWTGGRDASPAGTGRRGVDPELPDPDIAVRKLHRLNARWGVDRPEQVADTGNLSKGGMFLVTDAPPEPGTTIHVRLDIESCSMPLRGRVVWSRPADRNGQPPGMGIHLIRPPALYREFVAQLGVAGVAR